MYAKISNSGDAIANKLTISIHLDPSIIMWHTYIASMSSTPGSVSTRRFYCLPFRFDVEAFIMHTDNGYSFGRHLNGFTGKCEMGISAVFQDHYLIRSR
jgi:hypothetical protein